MATPDPEKGARTRGRPRTSHLSRSEQLRLAKRTQRSRERLAGQVEARLKLPADLAERLAFAARRPDFESALGAFLEREVIAIADYPQLQLLCWNRRGKFIAAFDAWSLYDRNARFVEHEKLTPAEQGLLRRLVDRFGGGAPNA